MDWVKTVALDELRDKGRALYRHDDKKIALFWVDGRPLAVDNRCPHEGYPLREGTVDAATGSLTCQWHNWKFNLETGRCVYGEDHVRAYRAKSDQGWIWLDLSEPPPETRKRTILEGVAEAVANRQYGRMAREVARLAKDGFDPIDAVRQTLAHAHDRLEDGMTHAHAGLADWLRLYDEYEGSLELQVLCLAEALDHLAHDTLRQPQFPYAEETRPFSGSSFLTAVEAEDEAMAVALVRGALAQGADWTDLEPWFVRAALAHYADFGHALIYVEKTGLLLARLGARCAPWLLPPLIRALVYATREDLLPEFRAYPGYAAANPGFGGDDRPPAADALFGLSVKDALAWCDAAMRDRQPLAVYWSLLEISARNLACFDERFQFAFDRPVSQNVGWLSFTHGLTFGHAARRICQRHPGLWRPALLQMACFVGRNKAYLDRDLDTDRWATADGEALYATLIETALDHGLNPPIFAVHYLKTLLAAREEAALAPQSARTWIWTAVNRFFQSRIKQKHPRRTARQALALIGG